VCTPADSNERIRACLEHLRIALTAGSGEATDVVQVTTSNTNRGCHGSVNEAAASGRCSYQGQRTMPARSTRSSTTERMAK
jgi:hypothetical protein